MILNNSNNFKWFQIMMVRMLMSFIKLTLLLNNTLIGFQPVQAWLSVVQKCKIQKNTKIL